MHYRDNARELEEVYEKPWKLKGNK